MNSPRPWQAGRAALLYQARARKLILALKHGDRPELAKPAARWMAIAGHELFRPDMLFAPVPLHWSRLAKRRYNQSALLAQYISEETGHSVCPDLLLRHTRTPILDGKTAPERAKILTESIAANPRHSTKMVGREILLVDDVMTSGATLTACTQACIASGAEHIFVLVLARVAKDA
ncbi:MAG: ComF family protein [Ruegeria sp.]